MISTFFTDIIEHQFNRRSKVMYEAHLIAYYYHWSVDSIMRMSIRERGEWCNLIRGQIEAENRAMKK